ncbi:MAG: MucB/RseB C-terminal domain-containing protein [Halioglobus sp.]
MTSLAGRSRKLFSTVLLLTLSAQVTAASCPGADSVALQWLDKMSRSSHEVNYHGVVTLERGDNMQVMQVSHSVVDGTASESLTQLTGQGAQVVRVDHPLHCVHPGHRLLRIGEEMQSGDCGIAAHYRFAVGEGEGDRIAGRKAVLIQIEPRDMYRYGYIMELDRETGLLLRARTQGRGQKTLERFQFANLSYTEEAPGAASAEVVHRATHPDMSSSNDASLPSSHWDIRWVPEGFTMTDEPKRQSTRKTYTDGLAVFSVFLEELSREIQPGEGVVRRGGTTSYTRGMRMSDQPVLVTVIGEVPLNTARMVADSVTWVAQ